MVLQHLILSHVASICVETMSTAPHSHLNNDCATLSSSINCELVSAIIVLLSSSWFSWSPLVVVLPHHLAHFNVDILIPCCFSLCHSSRPASRRHVLSTRIIHFLRSLHVGICFSFRGLPDLLLRHILFFSLVVLPRSSVAQIRANFFHGPFQTHTTVLSLLWSLDAFMRTWPRILVDFSKWARPNFSNAEVFLSGYSPAQSRPSIKLSTTTSTLSWRSPATLSTCLTPSVSSARNRHHNRTLESSRRKHSISLNYVTNDVQSPGQTCASLSLWIFPAATTMDHILTWL